MEATVFLFVTATKIYKFKAKDSGKRSPLCEGNISGDFSANNMKRKTNKQTTTTKKTGLNGCVYVFSVDYKMRVVKQSEMYHSAYSY